MIASSSSDTVVEWLARHVAGRSTRRSFLARAGRVAVFLAVGPTLASLLAGRAEARVCGQSGVSPKCPTYDCLGSGTTWGWCWYASGDVCCSDGGLKKICDCCKADHPNTHGYCPEGTNVYCIVESCWADPRVMEVPVRSVVVSHDAPATAARASRLLFPAAPAAVPVLTDASDATTVAVAGSAAALDRAPLLLTRADRLSPATVAELQRLGATTVRALRGELPVGVVADLARYGWTVAPLGGGDDLTATALDLARVRLAASGVRTVVAVGLDVVSSSVAPAVAAVAASVGVPLVIGADAVRTLVGEGRIDGAYLVGAAANEPAGIPNVVALQGDVGPAFTRSCVGAIADRQGATRFGLWLFPQPDPAALAGLAGTGGVLVPTSPGRLDGDAESWILARVGHMATATWVGDRPDDDSLYRLQGAVNQFRTHLLAGVSGQGLPVRSQPFAERELGRAQVAGVVPDAPESRAVQWMARANPSRSGPR